MLGGLAAHALSLGGGLTAKTQGCAGGLRAPPVALRADAHWPLPTALASRAIGSLEVWMLGGLAAHALSVGGGVFGRGRWGI